MIEIWEPRYRDKSVLIATYRLPREGDVEVKITKGFYSGKYIISRDDIIGAKIEDMKTKKGGTVQIISVPLHKLKKEPNETEES